ncbi:hypothetical protein CHH83_24250 [Bacillus sp. 7586-K]|uniref:hypothetical protein n=1 Tax=Metabacillus niabensis TaxID=324854 RepID=UPI000BA6394E|nr:hypothetical protein CHH83_24250 [Bacillus sp. 7586-K]
MLLFIYAFIWFILFLLVIMYYLSTALFWSIIFRAQKFENEGKRKKASLINLVSIALTILFLGIICHLTDTPNLFQFTKITSTCFTALFIYFVVLGIATIPFLKKDGTAFLKQALYGKRKKKKIQ